MGATWKQEATQRLYQHPDGSPLLRVEGVFSIRGPRVLDHDRSETACHFLLYEYPFLASHQRTRDDGRVSARMPLTAALLYAGFAQSQCKSG
jgi:hypothetical protein